MADSESAPPKTEAKLSWADVESDEEKETSAASSSKAADPSELKKIESLSIADAKDGEVPAPGVPDASRLLEDPDESDIKAVNIPSLSFSCSCWAFA